MSLFADNYTKKVISSLDNDFVDNWDEFRYGGADPFENQSIIKRNILNFLKLFGLSSVGACKQKILMCESATRFINDHIDNLEWLYAHLGDEESRQTLVDVIAYRALGHRKIKLAINTPDYWLVREKAFALPRAGEEIDVGFLGWKLQKVSLEPFGFPIQAFANKGASVTTFVHQQYRCVTPDGAIECQSGDHVIDAGACYGDTALYFSHLAGPSGRVASFEFLPQNLSVLQKNLDLNPTLAKSIQVHKHPVWVESGKELFISGTGPGTQVTEKKLHPIRVLSRL